MAALLLIAIELTGLLTTLVLLIPIGIAGLRGLVFVAFVVHNLPHWFRAQRLTDEKRAPSRMVPLEIDVPRMKFPPEQRPNTRSQVAFPDWCRSFSYGAPLRQTRQRSNLKPRSKWADVL